MEFRYVLLFFSSVIFVNGQSTVKTALIWDQSIVHNIEQVRESLKAEAEVSSESGIDMDLLDFDVTGLTPFQIYKQVCQHATEGVISFISATNCRNLAMVRSVLKTIEVPLIIVNRDPECLGLSIDPSERYTFMYPKPSSDITAVLADVVHDLKWEQVAVLWDEETVGPNIHALAHSMINRNVTVSSLKIQDQSLSNSIKDVIDQIYSSDKVPKQLLILCRKECVLELFKQANSHGILYNEQGFFTYAVKYLVALDVTMEEMESVVKDIDNVAVVSSQKSVTTESTVSLLMEAFKFLKDVAIDTAYQEGNSTKMVSTECGQKSDLSSNIGVTLTYELGNGPCRNCSAYEIHTAYWHVAGQRGLGKVAEWSEDGLQKIARIFPNENYGFNARHLTVSTQIWQPFIWQARLENGTKAYKGLCADILKEFSHVLNFTYTLSIPADGEFGRLLESGQWTGVVGHMHRKEADISVAPLTIATDRQAVMDFSEAYYQEYTTALLKLEDPEDTKYLLYIQPFQWQVWCCIAGAIPVASILIWVLTNVTPYYKMNKMSNGLAHFDQCFIYCFGSFFTQGGQYLPDAQSGRFFIGFWWMYCVVVIATYSGNLIAFLTVSKPVIPFNSFSDMVARTDYQYGSMIGTSDTAKLQAATTGTNKAIWDNLVLFNSTDPVTLGIDHEAHMEKVQNSKYAYIGDATGMEILMSQPGQCNLAVIKEQMFPVGYGIGLQKNSAYSHLISKEITKIVEGGLVNKWKQDSWPRQGFCSKGTTAAAKAVGLNEIQGAYYVLSLLIVFAIIFLAIETIAKCARSRELPQ